MKAKEIIALLEEKIPLDLQEEWDRSGLQCGNVEKDINKVMIGLDCDLRTLEEAIKADVDLLITHHPFLFNPLTLDTSTPTGQFIEKAMKHDLVIYSSHTPLDKVYMNTWLIEALGVKEIEVADHEGLSRKGKLPHPYELGDFLAHVKKTYNLNLIKIAGCKHQIETIAVCGGSGVSLMDEMIGQVDAYITGDSKYHDGQKAIENDLLLVDVGHHVEVIMVEKLKELLEPLLPMPILCVPDFDYYWYHL